MKQMKRCPASGVAACWDGRSSPRRRVLSLVDTSVLIQSIAGRLRCLALLLLTLGALPARAQGQKLGVGENRRVGRLGAGGQCPQCQQQGQAPQPPGNGLNQNRRINK